MPLYQATIPYRYVAPLVQILREQDPNGAGAIMAAAGLEGVEAEPADSSLPMSHFDALLVAASARLQRTDLGFEMGKRITIESHSPLGKILRRCASLEEIMLLLERYYHLITPTFAVRYLPGADHCEWRIRLAAPMSQPTLHMCLEMHAVSVHVDLHRMFGLDAVFDIYLSAPAPPHRARYDRLPCTRFHFSSEALPEVRCVIPTALVRRRLQRGRDVPASDDGSVQDRSSAGLQTADRYGDWVSLMLREAQTLQPTVQQLAALLNMAPRTLARRLADEGINFRELSNRIRHERACAMLADPLLPLHQIAYQLGYGDITAFIRGFRRASGLTPAEYRERAAG
jgi:AraC-like DNA-binding protein